MEKYYEAVRALASALLPVYAQALRMPSNFFQNSFNNPCWCIRLNYYAAPKEGAPPELGIPPHADGTFLDSNVKGVKPFISRELIHCVVPHTTP